MEQPNETCGGGAPKNRHTETPAKKYEPSNDGCGAANCIPEAQLLMAILISMAIRSGGCSGYENARSCYCQPKRLS